VNYKEFLQVKSMIKSTSDRILLPYFFKQNKHIICEKDRGCGKETVTHADIEMEKHLISELKKVISNATFVSEETNYKAAENYKKTNNPTWFIDLIDGTDNFVNGNDNFAVSVYYENEKNSAAFTSVAANAVIS